MSGYELLAHDLAACGRDGFTGELRVAGTPGGAFHLRDGLVVSVASPGAPGPEALLLRSGRVGGEQWGALVRESGGSPWPAAALIAHGYAGAAQLRVVCVMALRDAAFAVAVGRVEGCEYVPGAEPPAAPVAVGETPGRLLQDTARKLAAIAALPYPVRPDRERPVPALVSSAGARLTALQRELLTHADGRRTARDLAFRTGRGVYTVTVELARMLAEGFLECAGEPIPIPVRLPPDGQGVRPREPGPRREPAASGEGVLLGEPGLLGEHASLGGPVLPGGPAPPGEGAPTGEPASLGGLAASDGLAPSGEPAAFEGPAPSGEPAVSDGPAPSGEPAASDGPAPSGEPAPSPGSPSLPGPPPSPGQAHGPEPPLPAPAPAPLPRRQPGASGIGDALDPPRSGASWKEFFRLRNPSTK